jgi:ribosomal protein S18 acetylase RimI-like enzyme
MNEKLAKNENKEILDIKIDIAKEDEWLDYKNIRLEAIEKEPMAFYVTDESKKEEMNKKDVEWISELIDKDSFVILSKNNDKPIGMTQVILKDKNKWHIRGVYLNEKFRGSGCGLGMMNLTLNEIKNRGGKIITLNVMDTQDVARKMYEKFGFEVTSRFSKKKHEGKEYPGGQWMKKEI